MSIFNGTVLDLVAKDFKKLNEGEVFKAVFEREEIRQLVEQLNRKRLDKGKNTDGSDITNLQTKRKRYSFTTEIIYREIGRKITAGSNYTMRYKGDFHKSIKVKTITKDYFTIDANPKKSDGTNLFTTYGDFLIGASESDYEVLRLKALPLIYEYVLNKIGANI